MPNIHEQATLTSKGQITLPKAIRQALGVTAGAKVAFELRDGEVLVTRAESLHEDPAITGFLEMLDKDIRLGRYVGAIPEDLANAMLATLNPKDIADDDGNSDIDIQGDVEI